MLRRMKGEQKESNFDFQSMQLAFGIYVHVEDAKSASQFAPAHPRIIDVHFTVFLHHILVHSASPTDFTVSAANAYGIVAPDNRLVKPDGWRMSTPAR